MSLKADRGSSHDIPPQRRVDAQSRQYSRHCNMRIMVIRRQADHSIQVSLNCACCDVVDPESVCECAQVSSERGMKISACPWAGRRAALATSADACYDGRAEGAAGAAHKVLGARLSAVWASGLAVS